MSLQVLVQLSTHSEHSFRLSLYQKVLAVLSCLCRLSFVFVVTGLSVCRYRCLVFVVTGVLDLCRYRRSCVYRYRCLVFVVTGVLVVVFVENRFVISL